MANGRVTAALRARGEETRAAGKSASAYGGRFLRKDRVGEQAVDMALALKEMKDEETTLSAARVMRAQEIAGKTFHKIADTWVDAAYKDEMRKVKVKYASEAYFDLLKAKPEWKKIFMLGDKLILVTGKNTCLIIGDEGSEKLSGKEIKDIVAGR